MGTSYTVAVHTNVYVTEL